MGQLGEFKREGPGYGKLSAPDLRLHSLSYVLVVSYSSGL